jgi:hypothetical protein
VRRAAPEHEAQKQVVAYLRWLGVAFAAIPNGAKRSFKLASWLKAEGMEAGAPDIVIFSRPPKFSGMGIAIEMKSEKGRLSDEQRAFHERLRLQNWHVIVAFGSDDAICQLKNLGW